MKGQTLLLLGEIPDHLIQFFQEKDFQTMVTQSRLNMDLFSTRAIDFIISYRYRHLIQKEVIHMFSDRIINLHISFLPWNRGADPNLWSFLEDTPKGITIHYVDECLDTGKILVQKEYRFRSSDTLASTYTILNQGILKLLTASWDKIFNRQIVPRSQEPGTGSFHSSKDKEKYLYLMAEKGWDTPVSRLLGRAL